ncbi:hypothetical protein BWP33_01655 [Simonsiella muelleri ATCC 29453]|nr:hypothetical protein BWP33_01655 [Simonsiella muelleri ATCC 29453]
MVIKNKFLIFQLVIFLKFVNSEVLQRFQTVYSPALLLMMIEKYCLKISHNIFNQYFLYYIVLQINTALPISLPTQAYTADAIALT